MPHVFVTRAVPGRTIPILESAGLEVETWPEALPPAPDVLSARLRDAAGALAMITDRFDRALLDAAPSLRVVANMAVGYDNIDLAAADQSGVWVTNTPGVLAETTADLAFALLLAAARQVTSGDRDTREGKWLTWSPTGYLGQDVYGATLGIVGLGEIGLAVARRGAGFGMRLLYTSRTRKHGLEESMGLEWTPFDRLISDSDFISVHAPLTTQTRHLIGEAELARMKPTAILINTARGQIVDQQALIEALKAQRILAAAIDVADPEPVAKGDPLLDLPNLLITPHIGSASVTTRARMAEMAARNIVAVLAGEGPLNPVNRPPTPRTAAT